MILNPETRVAGFTERQIRDAYRRSWGIHGFYKSTLQTYLKASPKQIEEIMEWFVARGYASERRGHPGGDVWEEKDAGCRFRKARLRGIDRRTAQKALDRYVSRLDPINNQKWPRKFEQAVRWRICYR